MNGQRLPARTGPPKLGEHTVELLHGLGYADGDIEALQAAGVIASSGP
jgi:crotonobetainyl-CoA:carnitine CoA-transferase CaiB-like acyl-CoA transferase